MSGRKELTVLLALAVLLLNGPLEAQDRELGLICEPGCSFERERTATARLSWQLQEVPEGSRLDYTVYDGGFESCGFASFVQLSPGLGTEREFACSEIEDIRPFDLRLLQVEPAADERLISSVLLENLEAGVNYQFRLRMSRNGDWLTTETVMCPAPVCISDNE